MYLGYDCFPQSQLVVILYLMYSPVFLADYLMNDEWSNIGSRDSLREGSLGSQAGLVRGYVNNRAEQLDFVRTELIGAEPSAYRNIVVVLPQRNDCITEPCGPWAGLAVQVHVSQPGGYRYALATLGIAPESKTITFVPQRPDITRDDVIVVDWQRYASARYSQTHPANNNP